MNNHIEGTSNDNKENIQKEKSMLTELEEWLECKICYTIPRKIPIFSCEAGHIICQYCMLKVQYCPTCRRSLKNINTNNFAETQINFVYHKCKFSCYGCNIKLKIDKIIHHEYVCELANRECKFSYYGCTIKMKLEDLKYHEEICEERTITCPRNNCTEIVQLKKFNDHAIKEGCTVPLELLDFKYSNGDTYTFPYTILNFNKDLNMKTRKLVSFNHHNNVFYFLTSYSASAKYFFIAVMLAADVKTSSQYSVKITIDPENQRKFTYEGEVVSIEDLPDMDDEMAKFEYWIVAYDAMEPHINDDKQNEISIPFEIKMRKLETKRNINKK